MVTCQPKYESALAVPPLVQLPQQIDANELVGRSACRLAEEQGNPSLGGFFFWFFYNRHSRLCYTHSVTSGYTARGDNSSLVGRKRLIKQQNKAAFMETVHHMPLFARLITCYSDSLFDASLHHCTESNICLGYGTGTVNEIHVIIQTFRDLCCSDFSNVLITEQRRIDHTDIFCFQICLLTEVMRIIQ